MKNRFKKAIISVGALLLVACTPDNPGLGSILPESKLDFSITQNPEKDNILYLESKTKGIIPYWDYIEGVSNKEKDTVSIRFAGEYDIRYYAFDRGGSVWKSQRIKVSKNDEEYFSNPKWNMLTNGTEGKTWVWNEKAPLVYGNGGKGSTAPEWWGVSLKDLIEKENGEVGEMIFDLNQGANFTKKLDNGTTTKGTFNFNLDNNRLTLSGANILHGANYSTDGADGSYYVITKLTETDLVLARQAGGWQNTWVFRAK